MTGGGRAAPQNDSSLVILSEAKNLFSRLRGMAPKILRSEAPQNDRWGETRASERQLHCHSEPHLIVILSEAKNLFSSAAEKGPT